MRTKSWLALAVVTILVIAGAVYVVSKQDQATSEQTAEETLFPELMAEINDVALLRIRKGDVTLHVMRDAAGVWALKEKGNYRASASKVKKAVVAMADMRVIEAKTAKPELYSKISVQDVDAEGAESVLFELEDKAGRSMARLLVGRSRSFEAAAKPGKIYVRRPEEARAWLVSARLDVKAEAMTWLDLETVKVAKTRVQRVVTRHDDGETVTVLREDPKFDQFTLQDIADGFKLVSQQRTGAMSAALEYFNYEDVLPAAKKPLTDGVATTDVETRDGLRVTLRAIAENDYYWATVSAAYDESLIVTDDAAKSDTEAATKSPDQIRQEVKDINARVGGWVYKLPEYRGQNFYRRMTDLVEAEKTAENGKAGSASEKE
jgi:hypothetical protein